MQLNIAQVKDFFNLALKEDVGINGDITSNALINDRSQAKFAIKAREDLILAGIDIAKYYLNEFYLHNCHYHITDKVFVKAGTVLIEGEGDVKTILLLERVILNFLSHLSGVATLTKKFVDEISHTKAKITDTRKTIPGLRLLQKYAVTCGGGHNHRLALDSAIMIKDNHISAVGNIEQAIKLANSKAPHYTKVIVECDTLAQLEIALRAEANLILLDNMSIKELTEAVRINAGRAILEASGGVNLHTVKAIAETGVDFIAVGQLTHSAPAVDIGLDM